jgi:hypothetical protein
VTPEQAAPPPPGDPVPEESSVIARNRSSLLLAIAIALGSAVGCRSSERLPPEPASEPPPAHIVDCMTGTFSSAAQAAVDPEHYLSIRLVMVPIWLERSDAWWFYVEQAAAEALDRPYRQRVYRVSPLEGEEYRSDVYTLPGEALAYAGAWRDDRPLADLRPGDLALRAGCSIHLRRTGPEEFIGSTIGDGCESTLRGAAYATSQVRITRDRMESWDRGFDSEGNQVWGATEGPYIFDKIADGPPQ